MMKIMNGTRNGRTNNMLIGYARVSTRDQDLKRQLDPLGFRLVAGNGQLLRLLMTVAALTGIAL